MADILHFILGGNNGNIAIKSVYVNIFSEKCAFYFHNVRSVNVKDVWFDSNDEEGTLHSLAWAASLSAKQPQRLWRTISLLINITNAGNTPDTPCEVI
jgi:hypothetical protein